MLKKIFEKKDEWSVIDCIIGVVMEMIGIRM